MRQRDNVTVKICGIEHEIPYYYRTVTMVTGERRGEFLLKVENLDQDLIIEIARLSFFTFLVETMYCTG